MSHSHIPDFTDSELWVVRNTLKERYGKEVEPQLADTEVMLDGAGMVWCPALSWSARGANFFIVKTAASRYKAYFYFHPEHQLGNGIDSYDDIAECVVSVLQVEAGAALVLGDGLIGREVQCPALDGLALDLPAGIPERAELLVFGIVHKDRTV